MNADDIIPTITNGNHSAIKSAPTDIKFLEHRTSNSVVSTQNANSTNLHLAPNISVENASLPTAKSRLLDRGTSLSIKTRLLKKAIGSRLFSKIKSVDQLSSKRELADLVKSVKNRKKLSVTKTCELILEFIEERDSYRLAKGNLGHPSALLAKIDGKPFGSNRGEKTSFWRVPIERRFPFHKKAKRRRLIAQNYRQTESHWVGGERTIEIRYSEVPYAEGITEKVWHEKKVRSGTNSTLIVAFSPSWHTDVFTKGLSVVSGMVTTHATEIEHGVFRASWVEQGRGFSLHAVSGFIVVAGDDIVHGPTEEAAKQSACRRNPAYRAEQTRRATERAKRIESKLGPIRAMLERGDAGPFGEIVVTLIDSMRAGNCETGTTHWRNKHFPGRDSATIREVLTVEDQKTLVIGACLRAIRRSRALNRLSSQKDS